MTEIDKPLNLKLKVLHFVRWFLASIARVFCSLYYGKKGERLPPIIDDVLKQPAIEVARRIRNKEITSVEVLEACIRRIKDVNSALNCFVEDRFELAMKEAKEADELIRSGTMTEEQLKTEKPFLGVPFTTKDCIAVKGLHHTSGVVLRKDVIAKEDAKSISLLRSKGAIIMGLTNVPELCMWTFIGLSHMQALLWVVYFRIGGDTSTPDETFEVDKGWETHNHIHGRTNNPYNTTRIVGGSSGGEGCLQGAAGSIFGVGSDIGGSIRMPAYFNGIFGHKPSRNIVSNAGQYPLPQTDLLNSYLGLGPMTRHAVDLKPLLKIMSGDNASKLDLDKPVDVGKLKVYYQLSNKAPMTDSVDPDITAALKKVVEFLNVKHNIVAEEKQIKLLQKSLPIWMTTMKNKEPFERMIMGKEGTMAIVIEIFKNLIGFSGNTLIGLFTALMDRSGAPIGSERYNHYLKLRDNLEKTFVEMLGDDGVFLYPTHPTPAPYHNEPLLKPLNFSYTAIINCLGLPATTVPLGLSSEGLPIGIQVVANHNNDRLCLAVAEELEKGFGGWVEPKY